MKKFICILSLLASSFISFAQEESEAPTGADRLCGEEFASYNLVGKTFREALEAAGTIHNNYQTQLLTMLQAASPDWKDTAALNELIFPESEDFFSELGFNYDPADCKLNLAIPFSSTFEYSQEGLSDAAIDIIDRLQELVSTYDENNDESFFSDLNGLLEEALVLENAGEVFAAGIPVSVAIHSYTFWKENGQTWFDIFTPEDELTVLLNETSQSSKSTMLTVDNNIQKNNLTTLHTNSVYKPKINLYKLGGADVKGAVSGAVSGFLFAGPAGAFAIGVLGSAGSSLGNLTNQIIDNYVSWWPF